MRRSTPPDARRPAGDDAGFGMVEVLVAMLIFALVAVGIAYSVLATLRNTHDSKAREVALALAAEEISAVRAIGDPFDVVDCSTPRTVVQGETYTITRTTAWVNEAGSDAECSASGGTLRFLRVNVKVTWSGSSRPGMAAESNTLLAPVSRINTPGMGTVFVSVKGADGLGMDGISFSITPSPGTGVTIEPTDDKGCSILLGVPPGTYTVSLSKPGHLDYLQVAAPSLPGVVVRGLRNGVPLPVRPRGELPGALRVERGTPADPGTARAGDEDRVRCRAADDLRERRWRHMVACHAGHRARDRPRNPHDGAPPVHRSLAGISGIRGTVLSCNLHRARPRRLGAEHQRDTGTHGRARRSSRRPPEPRPPRSTCRWACSTSPDRRVPLPREPTSSRCVSPTKCCPASPHAPEHWCIASAPSSPRRRRPPGQPCHSDPGSSTRPTARPRTRPTPGTRRSSPRRPSELRVRRLRRGPACSPALDPRGVAP